DELGDKLQPRYLMDAIMDQLKMSGRDVAGCAKDAAKDTGQALWQSIKSNPMPLALIGSGVAWLIFNQRRSSSSSERMYGGSYVDARTGQPYDESYGSEFRSEMG